MALGRPHVGMKIAVCRANKVRERAAPQAGNKSKRHNPRPAPLDSGPVPGYRAGSSTESPMALLRPHERMKIAEYPMLVLEQAPALRYPPTPGLRPRIGVRGMLSIAGVTSREAILDRGPGHAFVVIAHASRRRHTKV